MTSDDLIRAYYDRFNAGDRDGLLGLLTDDVVHDISQGARETGRDAFARFLAHMDRCYAEQISGIVVMTAPDGRRAAAEYVVEGRYLATDGDLPAATGQTYRLPGGAFFEIRDGRITRVSNHYNMGEWLRQIGA